MTKEKAIMIVKQKCPTVQIAKIVRVDQGFYFATKEKDSIMQPLYVNDKGELRGLNGNYKPDAEIVRKAT